MDLFYYCFQEVEYPDGPPERIQDPPARFLSVEAGATGASGSGVGISTVGANVKSSNEKALATVSAASISKKRSVASS